MIPRSRIRGALFHLFFLQIPPVNPTNVPPINCANSKGRGDIPSGFSKPKIKKVKTPTNIPTLKPNIIPARKIVGVTSSRFGIDESKYPNPTPNAVNIVIDDISFNLSIFFSPRSIYYE
jgi:hypothetical protein